MTIALFQIRAAGTLPGSEKECFWQKGEIRFRLTASCRGAKRAQPRRSGPERSEA
jgi:hypothetical protein